MDQDPFAVWDDPSPAVIALQPPTVEERNLPSTEEKTTEKERLSLEYSDEDPGWGFPSSTSRVSTERTRKTAAFITQAETTPVPEPKQLASGIPDEETGDKSPKASIQSPVTSPVKQTSVPKEDGNADLSSMEATLDIVDDIAPHNREAQAETESSELPLERPSFTDDTPAEDDLRKAQSKLVQAQGNVEVEDDFDDFEGPVEGERRAADNDDFGDFDDFEDGTTGDANDFGELEVPDAASKLDESSASGAQLALSVEASAAAQDWSTLDVTPTSTRHDLSASIAQLFPLSQAAEQELSGEGLRQMPGLSQILAEESSRKLWSELCSFPLARPIDWVRSRTRRDYLISMGVPVNLDEIHSSFASGSGNSKALPPLKLKLDSSVNRMEGSNSTPSDKAVSVLQRSSSLKIESRETNGSAASLNAQRSASTSNSPRNGSSSPAPGSSTNRERMAERRREELGLGPAPQVDLRRALELVNKTEDQLTLMSLPALQSMLRELNSLTTSSSNLLTHHLTMRESFQADAEMYNSMIKELVTGATSRFGGSGGTGPGGRGDNRRATTIGVSASSAINKNRSSSGSNTMSSAMGARAMSPSLRGGAGSSPRR